MMTVDEIFADDRRYPPVERSLSWEETRGGFPPSELLSGCAIH
ncbi:hypothetical protein [Mesorhizobium sp.]|nr:hypothetical protein [Mesorhizobium sp.]